MPILYSYQGKINFFKRVFCTPRKLHFKMLILFRYLHTFYLNSMTLSSLNLSSTVWLSASERLFASSLIKLVATFTSTLFRPLFYLNFFKHIVDVIFSVFFHVFSMFLCFLITHILMSSFIVLNRVIFRFMFVLF